MTDLLTQRLEALHRANAATTLEGMLRGIEKESLRITPEGRLAQTPHPKALGSALTHPHITTDYSESLLEFITPPSSDLLETLEFLDRIHRYVYANIGDEMLWVNSMPCVMGTDSEIPVAEYGSSNIGMMKHIYRLGLGHRYGRVMQTIAGIHYNLSYPDSFWELHKALEGDTGTLRDFIDRRYFDLTRNFQRYSWLLIYLFGASPALCASFLRGRTQPHNLDIWQGHTLLRPYATSLRMSDLGYQNNAQSELAISYNSLSDYVRTLTHAIKTPYKDYEKIGIKVNGEYRQLNSNILQIENEYYSSIRPKRTTRKGERPTQSLTRGGVEYIEIRILDLNPFEPVGISVEQMRFLDMFATCCLLYESPLLDADDLTDSKNNIRAVVYEGRDPSLSLANRGVTETLRDWATRIIERMEPVADLFDAIKGGNDYHTALQRQAEKIPYPELTPSAQILEKMQSYEFPFFRFAMQQAQAHRDHFRARPLDRESEEFFRELASRSLDEQRLQEQDDTQSLDDFIAAYFRD